MRRPAPTVQLSPKVIRQFALITLIVTALLAMFSSGENAEVVQAFKDREAKNRLARAEANKLGADKVGTEFREQKREEYGEGFEKLNGPESGGSSSGSGGASWAGPVSSSERPAFMRADVPQPFVQLPPNAPKGIRVRDRKAVRFGQKERDALKASALRTSGLEDASDLK